MQETSEQMHDRLLEVIAKSRFEAFSRPYAWQGIPHSMHIPDDALAAVRDGSAVVRVSWGCPWIKGEAVIAPVERLRRVGLSRRSIPRS